MNISAHPLLKVFVVTAIFFAMSVASANAFSVSDCEVFTRSLRVGVSGADVLMLQRILNMDQATQISLSGLGSSGNETTYFGNKTKLAVIKFQEIYKNEVLRPVLLTSGNGFVGSYSRAKLHRLCVASLASTNTHVNVTSTSTPPLSSVPAAKATTTTQITTPIINPTTSSSSVNGKTPYIIYPSSYAVHQGAKVSIYGGGFTDINNTVTLGSQTWTGLAPSPMGTLDITIPQDGTKGKFDLWFTNAKGQSNKSFIVVTDISAVDPVVASFTPLSGPTYTSITLAGKGFSKEWNEVYLGSKIIKGITSVDGTTLTFNAEIDVPGVSPGVDVAGVNVSAPLWFYVVNLNGVSNSQIFTLKF